MSFKLGHHVLPLIAAALGVAVLAPAADAAQRYVAPAGSGVTCSQASPCPIDIGINSAAANDEVIIAPGDYPISSELASSANGLDVHGQPGAARPTITGPAVFSSGALRFDGAGVEVADLTIRAPANSGRGLFVASPGALVQRVDVLASGTNSVACQIFQNVTFRDSLCVATGTTSTALLDDVSGAGSINAKLRNDTLIATGSGSTAVKLRSGSGALTNTIDARNVIADGFSADIAVEAVTGGIATATLTNSNYVNATPSGAGTATVTAAGSGSNQTAAPIFTDTTAYHQDPGSPTVDAGVVDPDNGVSDLDGDARSLGSAPDIGADEYVPPDPPDPPDPPTPPNPPTTDTTAPETTIATGPKQRTKSKKATFTFGSNEAGATFACTIDKKAAAPCASPLKLKRLKKGKHKLTVVATDAAGNADATPATYSWKVKKKKQRR